MVVLKSAVFSEASGATGYSASFVIPANSIVLTIRSVNQVRWTDSGAPNLVGTFAGTGTQVFVANLQDPSGTDAVNNGLGRASGPLEGACYGSDRTLTLAVSGANFDGSGGKTRALVQYFQTDEVPVS